jgi:hypothetical protein
MSLEIIFKKSYTKNTITCRRPDGTATWMEAIPYRIVHDLTHYVVETELGMRDGFYGMLAGGWNITDFENKQKIRSSDIPANGIRAELIVNMLLTERNDGQEIFNFNSVYADSCGRLNIPAQPLEPEQLHRLRIRLDDLINKWRFMPMDRPLHLKFPV